ncbi:MAG: potassium transporter KefB, partial [Calditrichaeota bacterium]
SNSGMSLMPLLAKLALLLLFLYVSQRWLVPVLLFQITRTRSRELFLMTVAFLAFSIAWITSQIGLSLALGAFLAGLIISESEYSHTAFATILPLRDLFLSFFFVSVGMLMDIRVLGDRPAIILLGFMLIILLKFMFAGTAALLLRYPLRTVIMVGLSLAQVGEFSFILSKVGREFQLITQSDYQVFLSISILTMIATPFLMAAEGIMDRFQKSFSWLKKVYSGFSIEIPAETQQKLRDHLIIVGFGLNGRNLSLAAQTTHIPYIVIDINPDTIRKEKKEGIPIFYGDATHIEVLRNAGIERARILVIAINDPAAVRLITTSAREVNPNLYIIVRTRFLQEVEELYQLGADEVIPEEFETSVEIFTRVLKKYLIPEDKITEIVSDIRKGGYEMLRSMDTAPYSLPHFRLSDLEVQNLRVPPHCKFIGKTLTELDLREKYQTIVLVLNRSGKIISPVDPHIRLEAGDELIVFGRPAQLTRLMESL